MVPYKSLHAADSRVDSVVINGNAVKIQMKSGYLLCRTTLKQCCQLEDQKLTTIFNDWPQQPNQLGSPPDLLGTGAGDSEIHSDESSN